jgi:hypothetical protein
MYLKSQLSLVNRTGGSIILFVTSYLFIKFTNMSSQSMAPDI